MNPSRERPEQGPGEHNEESRPVEPPPPRAVPDRPYPTVGAERADNVPDDQSRIRDYGGEEGMIR